MIQNSFWKSKAASAARGASVGAALLMSACTVSSPLTIASAGEQTAGPSQIAISLPDTAAGETLKSRFAAQLVQAFAQQGVTPADSSALIADYAVSVGSAEMGLSNAPAPSGTAPGDGWISQPRKPKRFDECEAMVLRGTLLVLDKTDGSVRYRGEGTATECAFDDDALGTLADQLVADFIAR